MSAVMSRRVDVDLYLDVATDGPFPVIVKGLSARVYVEDIYLGAVRSLEGFTILVGEPSTVHLEATLDLGALTVGDLTKLASLVGGGELDVRLEGWIDLSLIVFTVTIPFSQTRYYLLGSLKPEVEAVYWSLEEAEPGEAVEFTVRVGNPYEATDLDGWLRVVVREDVVMGVDRDARSYEYRVKLSPGESKGFKGVFNVYAGEATRGFFLKIYWGSLEIYEMESSYPPRLKVVGKGELQVIDVYWVVGGSRSYSCMVGDKVEVHVVVKAAGGSVSGYVDVRVRKDLALAPDKDYAAKTFSLNLKGDSIRELVVVFTPDEASGGSLRGYFVELEGLISYTMPSDYPPRLTVHKKATGRLKLIDAYWVVGATRASTCKVGARVEAHIRVRAEGGFVSGSVAVKIRKDLTLKADVDYKVEVFQVNLEEGREVDLTVVFYPDEPSTLWMRGYFIELEGLTSWTMESSYPPRLKVYP